MLKIGGLGVMGAVGSTVLPWGSGVGAKPGSELDEDRLPRPFRTAFVRPPTIRPYKSVRDRDGEWVDHFELTMRPGSVDIVPGMRTRVFGYGGRVPGPVINVRRGRRSVVRFRNHLPAVNPVSGDDFTTSVHLHGSASLPEYDGYANDVTAPGQYKTYRYANLQRARTLWYHDHGVHHTAQNVYSGLFGLYQLHDAAERDLLPQGEFDVPLMIGDVMFRADGRLGYDDESTSGLWGDVIHVNGRPWPVMRVKRRVYRLRILNVAISRSLRLRLSTGDPMTVVATDGGLVPRSRGVSEFRVATAERYEVLVDFSRYRPGQRVVLQNLSNPNNRDFDHTDKVMTFLVTGAPFSRRDHTWRRIPDRLLDSDVMRLRERDATAERTLRVRRNNGQWTINDHTWQDVINSNFQLIEANPALGATEIWNLENDSGGWFHPLHIHLVDFRILSRDGRRPFDYELGPKDVAYVGENERVRVIARFGPHRGRYMVHCHNLPHEDHDMMVQFAVGWRPGDPDPHDPILAAPATVDNLPRRPR